MLNVVLALLGGIGIGLFLAGWFGPVAPRNAPGVWMGSVLMLFASVFGMLQAIEWLGA